MKSIKEIQNRIIRIAKYMDKSCRGIKGLSASEFYALLWVIDLDEEMKKLKSPELKKGQRDTFYYDNVIKLFNKKR